MSVSYRDLYSWRRVARLAALMMALTFFVAAEAVVANAQTKDASAPQPAATTTPQAEFQYSALTGSGDTVLATRVPAITSTGATIYWDVTLLFDVDENGNLTLDPAYPQIVKSPNLITGGFQAGNYVGPSTILGGQALITLSGPGVGPGGTTEWTLAASPGAASCTYPSTATWYVGSLASNPLSARLKKAGITSTAYSYGTGGSEDCYTDWETDALLGFSQVGNTITIYTFSADGTIDYNTPKDQITYTLIPPSSSTSARAH
jgi:hypothetical protein